MIKTIITDGKFPVKVWTDDIEASAREQLVNTSNLPIIFKHVAAMPDVHAGWGSTIGSVIPTIKAVIPAAVGVDVGCGMMAVKTDLNPHEVERDLKVIRAKIEEIIPVGHRGNQVISNSVKNWACWVDAPWLDEKLLQKAHSQLGSLGGGNHFIEICFDTKDDVWVMLHSGSRGVGNILAKKHIETAIELSEMYHIPLPDKQLAYLAEYTHQFDKYIFDVNWLQAYAFQNRIEMMDRIIDALSDLCGFDVQRIMEVNCHHNYVEMENHFNHNVWITRKGAVRARKGDLGIIPGSMGTQSFIVEGLGNPDSFNSCSHGAGRKMSRTKAKATFTIDDLEKQTHGVECRKDASVIDEIPGAYKDINEVMANQLDLVKIIAELHQVICVKG